jgi:lipopolysaccharide biosynthesis protein
VPQYSSNWSTTYPFSATAKKAKKVEEEKKRQKEQIAANEAEIVRKREEMQRLQNNDS